MRRTTIFRSKLLPVLAATVLVQGAAQAQDTTQVVRQDSATVTAAEPVVQSGIHVVQTGETLWSLAGQYLGDPLLWPAIYRLNTLVVEDPHWIFPGEELHLGAPDSTLVMPGEQVVAPVAAVPGDTVGAQPLAPTLGALPSDTVQAVGRPLTPDVAAADLPPPPPPPGEGVPTIFTPRTRTIETGVEADARARNRQLMSPSDFYSAGFLTENDRLPWAEVIGAAGKPRMGSLSTLSSARIFESVELKAPAAATYQVGDTLLVAALGREVPEWGRVVVPSGILRVRESSGERVIADVLVQYGRVVSGEVAMPVEAFRNPGTTYPTPIDNGMTGTIIDVRDLHPLPGAMSIIFISRGRDDGVVPGDIFEVLRPNPPEASPETPLQQVGILQVVHVRQRSASAQLIQISGMGVKPAAPVRLIRKMPS